jgi:small subunit ribosomal protein S15
MSDKRLNRKMKKAELIETFSPLGGEGSTEAQIAILTNRIQEISEHLKRNPNDNASRRGLMKIIGKRDRLLRYLFKRSLESYKNLTLALGIRRKIGIIAQSEEGQKEILAKYYAYKEWLNSKKEPLKPVIIDPDLIEYLHKPEQPEVDLLIHIKNEFKNDSEKVFADLAKIDPELRMVTSRICLICVSSDEAKKLTLKNDLRIESILMRKSTLEKGFNDFATEELENDSAGISFGLSSPENLAPLQQLYTQYQSTIKPCKVLVIDDGFNFSRASYLKSVAKVCEIGGGEKLTHVNGNLSDWSGGNGKDHGDRVVNIIYSIAPHAEFFIVQRNQGSKLEYDLGDILHEVKKWANGSPLIVNLSFGTNLGSHTGHDELEIVLEETINEAAQSAPIIVVKSAGNEGESNIHTTLENFKHTKDGCIEFEITTKNSKPEQIKSEQIIEISIWHDSKIRIGYIVETPSGAKTPLYFENTKDSQWPRKKFNISQNNGITMYWKCNPSSSECEVRITIKDKPLAAGDWKIWLQNTFPTSTPPTVTYRAWIGRSEPRYARFKHPRYEGTITIPGTASSVFTVAGHTEQGLVLRQSSLGPIYSAYENTDETKKPDIALLAASTLNGVTELGTSFSAARLTGCLALLLSISRQSLDVSKIRKILIDSCSSGQWGNSLGYGVLEYESFVRHVQELTIP